MRKSRPALDITNGQVPVQGEIPCGGCDETSVLQVKSHIHSYEMEVKPDEDGEDRILDVEVVIAFAISAYGLFSSRTPHGISP